MYLAIEKTAEGNRIVCTYGSPTDNKYSEKLVESHTAEAETVIFRVNVKKEAVCSFSFSFDGENFKEIGNLFHATAGRWVGAKLGIFALNSNDDSTGFADFDWVIIDEPDNTNK